MRFLRVSILAFLLLAGLAMVLRFFLLDQLLVLALEKSGAHKVQVQHVAPGLHATTVQSLSATFYPGPGEELALVLQNVRLQYRLYELLTRGRFREIGIDKAAVRRRGPDSAAKPFSVQRIYLLDNGIRSRLPLAKLSVRKLRLKGDFPAFLRKPPIKLTLEHDRLALHGTLSLALADNTSCRLRLQSPDAEKCSLDLVARRDRTTLATAHLDLEPHRVQGHIMARVQVLQILPGLKTRLPELPETGQLQTDFSLPVPLRPESEIKANLALDDGLGSRLNCVARGNPLTDSLKAEIQATRQDNNFLQADLSMAGKEINTSFSLRARPLLEFVKPYIGRQLPDIRGKISGSLQLTTPQDGKYAFTLSAHSPTMETPWFNAASPRILLQGTLQGTSLVLTPESHLQAAKTTLGSTTVSGLLLGLGGQYHYRAGKISMQIQADRGLELENLSLASVRLEKLHLKPAKPVRVEISDNGWNLAANTFSSGPLKIREGQRIYSTAPLDCSLKTLEGGQTGGLRLKADLTTPDLAIQQGKRRVQLQSLQAAVGVEQARIETDLAFSPAGIPGRFSGRVKHDMGTGRGFFSLKTSKRLDLDDEDSRLSSLLTPWPYPFDLDHGRIAGTAQGKWRPGSPMTLDAFLSITGGGGFFQQHLFEGLDLRQDLAILPTLGSKSRGSFSLARLIGAVDTHDIKADVNFTPSRTGPRPTLLIRDFSASLLGGTCTVPSVVYDINHPDSEFSVNIEKLSLTRLVDLINMESLHVTGRISGTIPIKIEGSNISVQHGELHNEPPGGEIRYTPQGGEQTGITGYALKAVEDFRYTSLTAVAGYAASGELDLDISLKGTSPGLNTSRPVHLNIHAEQNLPELIKSLRFSRGLTEKLDKRIKQHYK